MKNKGLQRQISQEYQNKGDKERRLLERKKPGSNLPSFYSLV